MRSRMVNRHSEFIASLAALRSAFGREGPDDQPAVRKACCRTMPQHQKKETKVVLIVLYWGLCEQRRPRRIDLLRHLPWIAGDLLDTQYKPKEECAPLN